MDLESARIDPQEPVADGVCVEVGDGRGVPEIELKAAEPLLRPTMAGVVGSL